jgi:hypothetical protein
MKELRIQRLKTEDVVSVLLITLLLPLIVGFIALGINLGHLYVTRNQLQNVDGTPATNQQKTLYFLPDFNPPCPDGHCWR